MIGRVLKYTLAATAVYLVGYIRCMYYVVNTYAEKFPDEESGKAKLTCKPFSTKSKDSTTITIWSKNK